MPASHRNVAVLAASLFGLALGEELWQAYIPIYLTALGASGLQVLAMHSAAMSIYNQQGSIQETTPVLTADDFRRIALGMKDAIEGAHMGHPDFRVNGRIFATIHTNHRAGMVKLTPEQQQDFIRDHPGTFASEAGAWGRGGCTRVTLEVADEETVGEAMTLAWQNIARTPTAKASKPARARKPSSRSKTRSPRTR